MIAWKFLRRGAVSPITRFAWPLDAPSGPGPWVTADAPGHACRAGIHACRAEDIAHWMCDELWQVELDGDVQPVIDAVIAPRARLLRRIDAWNGDGGARFLEHCVERADAIWKRAGSPEAEARCRFFVETTQHAAEKGNKSIASYCAASLAGKVAAELDEQARRFRDERAVQSAWIARQLLT